ncbi:MAG: hypothetical protein KF752_10025 [Pirellulaceae bacterium]|nr:hypothetical protein [Pirellulaceae bacterium]
MRVGAAILGELLEPAGFRFVMLTVGNSSGGQYSIGEFVRGNHRLELHYRFGLGIVIYHIGDRSLSHTELMRSQGFSKQAAFPTILDKSLLGFHAVLSDLRNCGGPFLDAESLQFALLSEWCVKNPKPTGFKALSNQ